MPKPGVVAPTSIHTATAIPTPTPTPILTPIATATPILTPILTPIPTATPILTPILTPIHMPTPIRTASPTAPAPTERQVSGREIARPLWDRWNRIYRASGPPWVKGGGQRMSAQGPDSAAKQTGVRQ